MAGNSRELLLPLLKEHESESILSTIILMIKSVVSEIVGQPLSVRVKSYNYSESIDVHIFLNY